MDVLETGKKRNDDKRPSRGEEKRGEKSARSIEQNAGASILKRHFDQRRSVKSVKWWTRINSITKNGSHLEEKDFLDHRRRMPLVSRHAMEISIIRFELRSFRGEIRGVIAWKALIKYTVKYTVK